ncbi:hypothetical protein AMS68_006652 [Peltaster fructicola]|uniref:Major facilitator superfamily (MFS) profile domain-containing protein n=1 Tax=Peltaster fructicola TaxID=286661 RepID=A0A6H0Y2I7_9PEZI|nr:hypothetical protein AMS68_006652 [Peltaster fructicola]
MSYRNSIPMLELPPPRLPDSARTRHRRATSETMFPIQEGLDIAHTQRHSTPSMMERADKIEPHERPSHPTPGSVQRPPDELSPRPDRRSLISQLSRVSARISMTPSDLQCPIPLVDGDQVRAEALLGLRDHELPAYVHPDNHGEPMNGRQAWLQACLAALIVFNCWGFSNAFGLFQAYYQQYYIPNTPPGTISWIGSTQLALVFGLGVPVGQLIDKANFRVAFHGGSVLMIVSLFCSSYCKTFATLWLVQGFLTGIGMGCIFTAGIISLMTWFDERNIGLALGFAASGSCIGGVFYILIARRCLALYGFGPTMRILSGVALATMILPNVFFRERRRVQHQLRPNANRGPFALIRVFAEPAYLLVAVGMFLSFEGLYFGFIYLVSYAVQVLHLSDTTATNMLIYMLLANLPGRLIPALASDMRFGPLNTMIPITVLSAIILCIWAAVKPDQSSLTAIACWYGFVSGGIQALYAPSIHAFCLEPLDDGSGIRMVTDRIGVKAGGIFSVIGVAVLTGNPIGGALVGHGSSQTLDNTSYMPALYFAASCLIGGGLFLFAARMKKVGRRVTRA